MFWRMWSTTSFDCQFKVDTTSFIFLSPRHTQKKMLPATPAAPARRDSPAVTALRASPSPCPPSPRDAHHASHTTISAMGPIRKHGGTHPPLPTPPTNRGKGVSQPRR